LSIDFLDRPLEIGKGGNCFLPGEREGESCLPSGKGGFSFGVILSVAKNLGGSLSGIHPELRFFSRGVYPEPDPSVASLPQDDKGEGLPQNDIEVKRSFRMTRSGMTETSDVLNLANLYFDIV
jgi:hypothetical protein